MQVSVILATYNRAPSLQKALETFSRLSCPPDLTWELLVIDNNSSDGTCEVVHEFARNAGFCVRYVFEGQQGRSAALNAGIAAARGEIIAFTDDDVLLHSDWLLNLKQTFDRCDCAAVGGRIVPLWNHSKPEWLQMDGQQAVVNFELGDEFREINFAPMGANSAFRRAVFAEHGLFRLDLGVSGSTHTVTCDDTEFGDRILKAGEKVIYSPNAIIYHPVDPQRTTRKYFLSWYYYNGVSLTRTAGLPNFGTFYFGVPRWLYRELLANFGRWMFCFQKNLRFNRKLWTYRSVGNIVESYRLSHVKAAVEMSRETSARLPGGCGAQ
jgi:glycosyltransferase involved in cell wall biosynthesis